MGLYWSTKSNEKKNSSLSTEPNCLMNMPPCIDFINVSKTAFFSSESAESLQVQTIHNCKLLDCQVVLNVFSTTPTEKFKIQESH